MAVADSFKIALNWNNTAGLALLNPQPKGDPKKNFQGILVGLPRTGGNGQRFDDGLYCVVPYNYNKPSDWLSILSQCGLSSTIASAKVTVHILNTYNEVYENYNGWAQRPRMTVEATHDMDKYRDIQILVTRLIGPL